MGELLRDLVLRHRVALAEDENVADTTEPANNSQLEAELSFFSINHQLNKELIPVEDESVLIENREELIRQITPTDITNSLLEKRVINLNDLEEIKQEERREGRGAGVEKLLDRIHRSGPDGLDKFIESLKSSDYSSLASKLQESRTRAEQETPNQSSANRVQESSQTITGSEPETQNECSANTIPELLETVAIAGVIPNKYSVNRLQESSQTRTIAERESPNRSCAGREDYNNGPEKYYVKSRVSSCYEEILRKNHLSIIENVRVNDIIDHLYNGKVLDWNDMDVIKTKLKSEGNREALRHLMEIIYYSTHTILQSFMDCLYQTGYDDIARNLQDDMDCGDKIPSCYSNNYQMIMDNVRVDDIIDHLYSKCVIEFYDMDVINRKLKSEGNREALVYIMDIIYHSGPAVLPSFIDCLYQNGYGHIVNCLQNDMGSMKVNDEEG